MNKKGPITFWQALLGGVLIVLLMTIESGNVVEGQLHINANRSLLLLVNYIIWAIGIHHIYRVLLSKELNRSAFIRQFLPAFLIIIILQLMLSNLVFFFIKFLAVGRPFAESLNELWQVLPQALVSRVIDLTVIVGILKVVDSQQRITAQKLEVAELQSQLTQTKLDALQMQLNPHFLFNALHAIHALIGYDNDKSKKMLLQVSRLLRKILELGNQQMIAFEEELTFFETYLSIEQERFHDRLVTRYHVDNEVKNCYVPSLLLQPLLENALKHGISSLEGSGEITLEAHTRNERLLITLSNTFNPHYQAKESTGIGLNNVKKRLETLFPDDFQFETNQNEDTFTVTIDLPKHDI